MLFAAYAATLGIGARAGSDYAGDEPHFLLAAASIADGDGIGLAGAYTERTWTAWQREPLISDGEVVGGRLVEPRGIGFALLIAPAYALGGPNLVEALLAAIAALGFALAAALARRVVPDPWATWAALLAGLSPPALAHATAVTPALTAGALLAGAALCALAVRERPQMRTAFAGAAMLAVLPWLDPWLLVPAAPIAALLARWTARRGRAVVALGTLELQLASLVFYVSLNERLYGGFTPLAVAEEPVTGASSLGDYVDRVPRLVSLWLDRDVGLLRWAPVLALAFLGAWLLWRSRRERLGRLVAEQRDAEHAAFLALAVCAGQVAVAAFALVSLGGLGAGLVPALPCAVPLVAWGLRHAPRVGWLLGALTLLGSVGLVARGGWSGSDAPWWPLVGAWPLEGSTWADVVGVVAAAGVGALLVAESLRRRRELRH
ncbi:MAG TPA: hypothetical protein VK631_01560 [Solirubrobacteraceae bacterium]|nr:hypothetical protein [Solirubrobacteraceae bacterium]